MASKKSKVLAIAFCAAVMAGIHVNPVLAAEIPVNNGSVTVGYKDFETTTGYEEDSQVTITNIASQDEVKQAQQTAEDAATLAGDALSTAKGVERDLEQEAADREKADADLQDQIDGHTNQINSMGDQLDDLKANDEVQDGTLANHQEQLDEHKGAIDSLNGDVSGLIANDAVQDETLANHQEQLDEHKGTIDSLNGDVSGLIANDAVQDETLANHQEQLEDHSQQLDAVRGEISEEHRVNGEQNETLADHQEQLDDHSQQLDAVRGEISEEHRVNGEQNETLADHQEQLDDHSQQLDEVRGEISEEHRVNGEQNETLADHQEQLDDHSQQLDEVRGEISSEIRDRTEADKQLQQSIDIQREVIGADSTEELQNAYSGTNYISDAENMVEADRKLDAAISDVNSRVDGIENRVDGLEDRIDKVGAMAAAIANLRTMGYDPAAPTEVAVGVGQYRDETGMALGLFHYPNRDFMLSLSVSTSGDEYMGGIGATWKFGRKSPEKVAEIKKAQAEADARRAEEQKLAKAEEMKKAAKEAKVQAQMERHAKLAAERAALEEA